MSLKFLGRGSGFAYQHTSAYFTTENKEFIVIDCPVSTFQKLRHIPLKNYDDIYVLITHTHGDHVGGLGLFVQYVYFTLKKKVTIVAPSAMVAADIRTLLMIEGNDSSWFNLITVENLKDKPWFCRAIRTKHSPELDKKCFGYQLVVDKEKVIYTGDTSTLEPFLPYISKGTLLYVDTSVYYGMIHLKLEDMLGDLIELTKGGVKVYLMHLDDDFEAEKRISNYSWIEIVEVITEG